MWEIVHSLALSRRSVLGGLAATLLPSGLSLAGPSSETLLHRDDFTGGLGQWVIEAERGGRFRAEGGVLDIDSPAGVTLWFRHALASPVAIDYEVMAVSEGGPNDAVSDINCFWMATDTRASGGDVLAIRRSGAFAGYDELRTYYAGIGGNRNTTSRFRRYVGRRDDRPLLPQHDLSAPEHMIAPNRWYRIRLVADGNRIELLRDGTPMFRLNDPAPYTCGHFGLRTTKSHLRVRNFRVYRLPG
ncbi:DUF1080 domain-containing protein [Pedomonas mirosovicensis]|uniref:DUF1080 domain-containing protein n=1 Tax=Pedomonas mirosovicensis TaxID=2908641 RepID=UPI002168B838|nr:DUF1080 domain-containing protein [Pedomonas mirosovicensis]MCH8686180.1 DUF1080 domain-containing protein [Pedomonas mirosovicensis]